MNQQQIEIRDQQKASWDKFSAGWKKWDAMVMDFLQPVGDEMVKQVLNPDDEMVLDIAAGTGEPGITIASRLKHGKVVITDLSDDMLVVARENAARKGVKNIETRVCDVSELPFADNTFDAVSCRYGYMFFPDMQLATNEIYRVLKPGGRFSTAVWNVQEKNFWITAMGGTINRHMQIPPPAKGAPGMFRCADPGLMIDLFQHAGFRKITTKEVPSTLNAGTAETYWNMLTEIAAPFVSALSNADDQMRAQIKKEVLQLVNERYPDGKVNVEASSIVVYGEK